MSKEMFASVRCKKEIVILLLSFWVVAALLAVMPGAAQAQRAVQSQKKAKVDKNQPIQIVSDRLDAYDETKNVIFSGNAVATQGDKVIKADRLIIHYKENPDKTKKKEVRGMGETGDLDQVEAVGHLIITQTGRVVTGDHAIFYQDSQKVVMTGNAVMREGKNVIVGHRIIVYLDEDRGVVESDQNKRVTATIYPSEKKQEKK
jgi:lipopolysaccharide export system protein LptA